MERNNNDLDFLTEVANQISARSQKSAINPDEILDAFKDVLDSMVTAEIVDMPLHACPN
ncbi:hypothetical protein RZN25_15950 [Bacillaceae bacterium S4-13-56]